MNKKIISAVLALILILSLAACGNSGSGTVISNNSADPGSGNTQNSTENTPAGNNTSNTSAGESGNTTESESAIVIDYELTDLDGNPVSTLELFSQYKYTMVNVWTSGCGPCVRELPELAKLSKEFEEQGCALIGILGDGYEAQGLSDGKDLLKNAGAEYLNLVPTNELLQQLGIQVVPTSFFVDSSGRVAADPIFGALVDEYRSTLEKLLSK